MIVVWGIAYSAIICKYQALLGKPQLVLWISSILLLAVALNSWRLLSGGPVSIMRERNSAIAAGARYQLFWMILNGLLLHLPLWSTISGGVMLGLVEIIVA